MSENSPTQTPESLQEDYKKPRCRRTYDSFEVVDDFVECDEVINKKGDKCCAPRWCHPSLNRSCRLTYQMINNDKAGCMTTNGLCIGCLKKKVCCFVEDHPSAPQDTISKRKLDEIIAVVQETNKRSKKTEEEIKKVKSEQKDYEPEEVFIEFDYNEKFFLSAIFHPTLLSCFDDRYDEISDESQLRLYRREVYSHFYQALSNDLDNSKRKVLVITGTPGIGKSYYQFFLLEKLLSLEKYSSFCFGYSPNIFFNIQKIRKEVDEDNNKTKYYFNFIEINSDKKKLKELKNNNTICFYDYTESAIPSFRFQKNIIFSSPNPARYAEFNKQHGNSNPYYMPVWNENELGNISSSLDSNWEENYKLCGGIPRTLKDTKDSIISKIQRAIDQKGDNASSIENLTHRDTNDKEISHILAFPMPTDENYHNIKYILASSYIAIQLSDKFNKNLLDEQINHIKSRAYHYNNSAGRTFEELVLISYSPPGGSQFEFQSLTDESKINFIFPAISINFSYQNLQDAAVAFKPGVFYHSQTKNLASIDAFYILENPNTKKKKKSYSVFLFQVTIADTHSVKYKGLTDILHKIDNSGLELSHHYLVFVVPPDSKLTTKQSILTSKKEPIARTNNIFQQYLWKYDFK